MDALTARSGRTPRPSFTLPAAMLAAGLAVAGSWFVAAVAGGAPGMLLDLAQQLAASGVALVVLFLSWRSAEGERRLASGALLVAMGIAALSQVLWDVAPPDPGQPPLAVDALLVASVVTGLAGMLPVLFGGLGRTARTAALLDALTLLFTGATLVAVLWPVERHGTAASDLPGMLTAVGLVALSAGAWMALVARRIQATLRGGYAVILGMPVCGLGWISWLDLEAQHANGAVPPADLLLSIGMLLLAYGAATWDGRPSESPTYLRLARRIGDGFPIAATLFCLALEVLPGDKGELGWTGAGTAGVVLTAVGRQLVLLRSERRARTSERETAALLTAEVMDRADTIVALAHLEPADTPAETARRICRIALQLHGMEIAVIKAFTGTGETITLDAEGFDATSMDAIAHAAPADGAAALMARASTEPWASVIDPETADPHLLALRNSGILGWAMAPLTWNDVVVGVIALGTRSPAAAAALPSRLSTMRELGVVASAIAGPGLAEMERVRSMRAVIAGIIDGGAYRPVFQPIVELASSRIVGYEARHPLRGRHAPRGALPRGMERRHGCRTGDRLPGGRDPAGDRPAAGRLARGQRLTGAARHASPLLDSARATDRRLVIEITEQMPIHDYRQLADIARYLRTRVRLSVDDAGSGYAGLRHILELQPDFVKLDLTLVRSVDTDLARQALIASMARFAEATSCSVIAEGIETEAELAKLRDLGVTFGQGFALGRPEPIPAGAG